jgi:exosome complex exonuclease RRP6
LNILKPQKTFEHVPGNDETGPFKPLLTYKPHAIVPLEKSLKTQTDYDGVDKYDDTRYLPTYERRARALEQPVDENLRYQHPYKAEIEQYKFPTSLYLKSDPTPPLPFESTTATFVDTPKALAEMLVELKAAKEIAIDLEHHDSRSYVGIVSLMQISTRNRDWIVDTLKPWRRKLECLNEVFADPNILKVFHGSAMDMIWLQRDFGLYIVGLFDTERAAVALRYPGRGLAYLLARFVNVQAQKQHQLADWRVRYVLRFYKSSTFLC